MDELNHRRDATTTRAILEFVGAVAREGSPGYVRTRGRVAIFDAEREFDYTSGAEDAPKRAEAQRWTVVSIKNDRATVFDGAEGVTDRDTSGGA